LLFCSNDEQQKGSPFVSYARTIVLSLDLKPCQTSRLLLVNNNNKDIEQQHQHLTQFELDGLQTLCSLLRKLKDKSIPEDLIQTQQLLESMEVNFLYKKKIIYLTLHSFFFLNLASSY